MQRGNDVTTQALVPCACLCGEWINPIGSKGRVRRFAYRHYLAAHLVDSWARLMRSDADPPNLCWEWPGGVNDGGYGVTKRNGQNYVHRAAWVQVNGAIPDGLEVCHHCDNPPCFRPRHLFLGTTQDNAQDMARKGRWRNGAPPPLDVEALKAAYLSGTPLRLLPRQFSSSRERTRRLLVENGVSIRKDPEEWQRPLLPTCHDGHVFDEKNTYVDKTGRRHCRKCRAAWARKKAAKLAEAG